jgi:PAS domain S-box-containing protein
MTSMPVNASVADEMVQAAVKAVRQGGPNLHQELDRLPAAIYATDARGVVTHFNRACILFAGRTPRIGQDIWCVTWKLYTEDGEFLPHEECPMAVAIHERRAIRGVEAVAERPDGTHAHFRPHPTPMLDEEGNFLGAVNLLLDVTARKRAQFLRREAAKCLRLVNLMFDEQSREDLKSMAAAHEAMALGLERSN